MDKTKKTKWKMDALSPKEACFPANCEACPSCGSGNLNTLAWTACQGTEVIDPVTGADNPPGVSPMIACFDCHSYNIYPVEDLS